MIIQLIATMATVVHQIIPFVAIEEIVVHQGINVTIQCLTVAARTMISMNVNHNIPDMSTAIMVIVVRRHTSCVALVNPTVIEPDIVVDKDIIVTKILVRRIPPQY